MSNETSNYEAVLADLRAKRDRLDVLIRGIEEHLGLASDAPLR